MKKHLLILVFIICLLNINSVYSQVWTHHQYAGGSIKNGYVSPTDSNELILFASPFWGNGMMRSHDGGMTLNVDEDYSTLWAPYVMTCYTQPDSFFILGATDDDFVLLFSPDQGVTFEDRYPLENRVYDYDLYTSWANPNHVCFYHGNMLTISLDAGETWNENDLSYVVCFQFDPFDESTWYALTRSPVGGLYKTVDYGQNWVRQDSASQNGFELIHELTIDASNPDIMFSKISYSNHYEKVKSVDGGVHWQIIDDPPDIIGYDYDRALLIVEGNQLYSSYDGGETLVPRLAEDGTLPLDGYEPFLSPDLVFTQPDNRQNLWVHRNMMTIRTSDGGVNWEVIGNNYEMQHYFKVKLHPYHDDELILMGYYGNAWNVKRDGSEYTLLTMTEVDQYQYSAIDSNTILRASEGGYSETLRLAMSTDGGNTWDDLSQNLPHENEDEGVYNAAMLGADPDVLFAGVSYFGGSTQPSGGYCYKSLDRGGNWERIESPGVVKKIVPDPYNLNRMYFVGTNGVFRYNSDTDSCTIVHPDLPWLTDIHPLTGDIICNHYSYSDIWYVPEDGSTCTEITNPSERRLSNLQFHPTNPSAILLSTDNGALYYTEDLGVNWREIVYSPYGAQLGYEGLEVDADGKVYIASMYYGLLIGEWVLGVQDNNSATIPESNILLIPYPNPFNSTIQIPYRVKQPGKILFRVYDMLGREVTFIERQQQAAGDYRISWDTQHMNLPSGTYILQMETGGQKYTRRITLVK